jgi:hypothetical protein
MFKKDIEEFKNSKILKYLFTSYYYLEGMTRKAGDFISRDMFTLPKPQFKRVS